MTFGIKTDKSYYLLITAMKEDPTELADMLLGTSEMRFESVTDLAKWCDTHGVVFGRC